MLLLEADSLRGESPNLSLWQNFPSQHVRREKLQKGSSSSVRMTC